MKFRIFLWLVLSMTMIGAVLLAGSQPVQAQSETACINCHETQAKNPVRTEGDWHIQHNTLACELCHAGNPAGETQEAAHTGLITEPLEAGTACMMCHPDSSEEKIATYQTLLDATATAEAGASSGGDELCKVIATECVAGTLTEATPAGEIAATEVISPTTAAAAGTTGGAASGGTGGFTWMKALQFTRGPLFEVAFWFCMAGLLLRLIQALRAGWKHRVYTDKTGRASGAGKSFAEGLLVLPFLPGLKGAFQRRPIMYVAGGLFHLGLFAVVIFSQTHMSAWKGVIGFGWPVLPGVYLDWLAAAAIVAMLALLIYRIVDPVLRLISGPAEWVNWLLVFLPMATGFVLARQLWLPYEVSFTIHMLLVDILLIWIPLSRISHFVFYFISRTIHGVEFKSRRVAAQ